jgi:glycosyltransferase involved in cell wall biosynthesis
MKLTIITINYNNKEGLVKTFDSVRVQTWKDFEFIVIDGGSTDGCKELIEQNHQINYWVSEKDSGVYNAMNKGIRKATGDYVIFMNSGDFFMMNLFWKK